MDFSDRICSGDGLGTKKGSGFYLKMVEQLILNLSVFPLFVFFFKEEIVLQLTFFSRFLNPPLQFFPRWNRVLLVVDNDCLVPPILSTEPPILDRGPAALQ